MKISILVCALNSNPIVRVYPIARVLQRHFEVEIIGSYRGRDLFTPYQEEFEFKAFRYRNTLDFVTRVWPAMHRAISGDVIYAFKPRVTSYGVALYKRRCTGTPVILDIEDWEMGQFLDRGLGGKLRSLLSIWRPDNALTIWAMEKMVPRANQVVVVSTFLQHRFGGVKLVHGADTRSMNPDLHDQRALRQKWHLPLDAGIVLFAGKPAPHKGVLLIVQALSMLRDRKRKSVLLLVGGSAASPYVRKVLDAGKGLVIHFGYQRHELMPELLAASDCVAVPQLASRYAQAQVPGKVFEALAMAKPVVASRISDLPELVDDCGLTFEPGDVSGLAEALSQLLEDDDLYANLARRAREKAVRLYSWDAMEPTLLQVFSMDLGRHRGMTT